MSVSPIDGTTDMSELTTETPTIGTPEATASLPAPRTRWAAVIWGLAFAGIAAGVLWITTSAARRGEFVAWLTDLSPWAMVGYMVLALGALLLVTGAIGLIRRAQKHAQHRAQERAVARGEA